jgi:hypothetical protein
VYVLNEFDGAGTLTVVSLPLLGRERPLDPPDEADA